MSLLTMFVLILAVTQDPAKVAPTQFTVLLENDEVRVLEFHAKKGDLTPVHSHPAHVVYPLGDGKTTFTLADGTERQLEITKGKALWAGPVTHSHQAVTDNDVLIVELKKAAPVTRP
jgi:quercetin dioxygenase-like cupin family protein